MKACQFSVLPSGPLPSVYLVVVIIDYFVFLRHRVLSHSSYGPKIHCIAHSDFQLEISLLPCFPSPGSTGVSYPAWFLYRVFFCFCILFFVLFVTVLFCFSKTWFLCITEPWLSWIYFVDQAALKPTDICLPLSPEC